MKVREYIKKDTAQKIKTRSRNQAKWGQSGPGKVVN
jgi:hypothetical protein